MIKISLCFARCQRQNTEWAKRLLRRCICVEVCIAVPLAIVLTALIAYLGVDPFSLFFLFSMMTWVFQRIAGYYDALSRVRELAGSLSSFSLSSKENILQVQEKMFEYWKASYLVSDWLYRLFKKSDELVTTC